MLATADALISRMISLPIGRSATIAACGRTTFQKISSRCRPSAARGLPLAARHRADGAAEDLGLVGGGVQREGEERRS